MRGDRLLEAASVAAALHAESMVIDVHDHDARPDSLVDQVAGGVTAKIYKPMADGMYFDESNRRVFPGPEFDWTAKYVELIGHVKTLAADPAAGVQIVTTIADLQRAKRGGVAGIIFGNEGSLPVGDSPAGLDLLYTEGLREIALFWPAGRRTDHVLQESGHLTSLGRSIIEQANHLGIVVDVCHLAHTPAHAEALELSKAPVLHTHGAAKYPRNWALLEGDLEDSQIRAIADKGGVIGVHFCTYIKSLSGVNMAPRLSDLVDHIKHLIRVGGVDSVGIGADHFPFNVVPRDHAPIEEQEDGTHVEDRDWSQTFVVELATIRMMPRLTVALAASGIDDDSIRKILGGNVVRVLTEAWRA